ncbi:25S rRNA (adenine(2142)-N(1))-methyltransferase-like [Lytechinus variegatus]|uniref:25S rRNA (adenine(2142)-N(1))-methyltransferase-like n=1 Tax=Lytechinus variegatus TaxID=7654 RepID=UPI001BB102BC|nr:25S rRNA (adenine(2142)-N(1))-methyltransferase-like [Lytechinus variegatus]
MKTNKRRKKPKKPVTAMNLASQNNESSKFMKRKIISRLHTIMKDIDKVKQDTTSSSDDKKMKVKQLELKIEELGGLQAYQQSSLLGEHLHGNVNTSKWVLQKLKEANIRSPKGSKLCLLDVGALQENYSKQTKWLDAVAIDLNPQCEGIIKSDFFDFKVGESDVYDIIVLSLVLNFVSSPSQRGEMLKRCQTLCRQEGHIFIVLPRACLDNSRYLDHALFEQMMESLNFDLVAKHDSKKLSFLMFRKAEKRKEVKTSFHKREVRNGTRCNNFCIIMR